MVREMSGGARAYFWEAAPLEVLSPLSGNQVPVRTQLVVSAPGHVVSLVCQAFGQGEGEELRRQVSACEQGAESPGDERGRRPGKGDLQGAIPVVVGPYPAFPIREDLDLVEEEIDLPFRVQGLAVGIHDLVQQWQTQLGQPARVL